MHAGRVGWPAEQITRAAGGAGRALPRLDFAAEAEQCPSCEAAMAVCKSRTRTVVSLAHGAFEAREILKQCAGDSACAGVVGSDALRRVVPPHQRYGYDLMVHVGMARYLEYRQRDEIRAELREGHGIEISAGTVSNLCDRFLTGMERLHLLRVPALRAAMDGGYPLHLDATCEHGRGGLFVILDGWRGWVLAAKRIQSESHEELRPLVDQTVARFGEPVAVMRDLGDGMAGAVAALCRHTIPDLVCHYHFLAAVGEKLLDKPYSLLRHDVSAGHVRGDLRILLRQLRRYNQDERHDGAFGHGRVREELAALVLWLLDGDGRKEALFPFSLPLLDFVRRCETATEMGAAWVPSPRTQPERQAMGHLQTLLTRLRKQPHLTATRAELDEGWHAFCELRDVLRLGHADLPRGDVRYQQQHLPRLELLRLAEIEQNLLSYRCDLEQRITTPKSSPAYSTVLAYLRRYGAHLFGHPARRDADGNVLAVVARTNNAPEHLFGSAKQGLRRRLGRAHLARDLQEQPAQATLVTNLRHPDYVRALCGSLDNLPSAIAGLDAAPVEGSSPLVRDHRDHRLHRCIRRLRGPVAATPRPHEPDSFGGSAPQPSVSQLNPPSLPVALVPDISEHQLRTRCASVFSTRDPRLPPAGTLLYRSWQGVEHCVLVLENGFEYQGLFYASLSLIARTISHGRHPNGLNFFSTHRPDTPTLRPVRPAALFPLGPLAQQIRAELVIAGYAPSTSKMYLMYVQHFANYHMRSPVEMGEADVCAFLLHISTVGGLLLTPWRRRCAALRALYGVVLRRPHEVERIPDNPNTLGALVAQAHESREPELKAATVS